ncbi:MAG: PAS domain-containing protein [Wenzhouxiangella sp.]|jgi:PAS domain S-box-containing protein|nr:PAS domain-containing protein [Wenzhouxiangella sp.]
MDSDDGDKPILRDFAAELLETMLEVSGLLVVVLDSRGRLTLFNRASEELTGYSSDEVLGREIWPLLIPPDEVPAVKDVHQRLTHGEGLNLYINHWLTRDGKKRLIQWRNAALLDQHGNHVGVVGTGIDITEQERALRTRLRWEHERHSVLDALPILIAHVGPDFHIRFANDGYRQWFGLDPTSVVGKHVASVIGERAFEVLAPHFREAVDGHRSAYHGEVPYLYGPARFIHGTYIPALDEVSGVDGFYIVAVDLTEQHRLQEELNDERDKARREAQTHLLELSHATRLAATSELATGLAHEISQPLTAISASAEACLMLLENHPGEVDSLRPALEKIAAQGQRARQIIEQLRNFLRREQDDVRIEVDPEELVEHVLLLLDSELVASGVEVETMMDPEAPPIGVNRVQIEQVLFNLVRNAIDVLKDFDGERRIRIRCLTVPEKEELRFEVSDSGPGLTETGMPKLFSPFYTTKPEGLGQGLAICRSIIDRHGGSIQAKNHSQGGALFSFTLPLEDAGNE